MPSGLCMCGCNDCYSCHPGNFREISGRHIYIRDLTDYEITELERGDTYSHYDSGIES
jgi:hypothetical protein